MAIEYKKMFSASWKRAATFAGAWAAIVGAFSLIMNAVPDLIPLLLIILAPISLVVPAAIGIVTTKTYAANGKIELKPAAANGAISGIVYAIVMIDVALVFIFFNYMAVAFVWGSSEGMGAASEIVVQGILVMITTLLLGLPILALIGIISGGIGGAIYSYSKK